MLKTKAARKVGLMVGALLVWPSVELHIVEAAAVFAGGVNLYGDFVTRFDEDIGDGLALPLIGLGRCGPSGALLSAANQQYELAAALRGVEITHLDVVTAAGGIRLMKNGPDGSCCFF